jgi:hypothetical protein
MIGRNGGRRVFVKASSLPPLFAELTRTFEDLRRPPSTIKYWAGKDVPGLEVLFADDRFDVRTAWKTGDDFRLLTVDKVRRVEINNELESFGETSGESGESTYEEELSAEVALIMERQKRAFDEFAWFSFSGGALGPVTSQPADAQYIPVKDAFAVPSVVGHWKARAGAIEIRADEKGLYKLTAGKLSKIWTGGYAEPVITPDARWVVATKYDDEEGTRLVRLNLSTNKEFVVVPGELPADRAIAFIASINRVLVGGYSNRYDHYESESKEENGADGSGFSLLDPETGRLIRARGEVRPLAQQTFRALQPAANPFEFWAAIPKGDETVVGIYNTRIFTFKPVLKLPRIRFDSMDMWAAAGEGKVYFVYEGHLLAAPINPSR